MMSGFTAGLAMSLAVLLAGDVDGCNYRAYIALSLHVAGKPFPSLPLFLDKVCLYLKSATVFLRV